MLGLDSPLLLEMSRLSLTSLFRNPRLPMPYIQVRNLVIPTIPGHSSDIFLGR